MSRLKDFLGLCFDPKFNLHWSLIIFSGLLYANIWANDVTYRADQVPSWRNMPESSRGKSVTEIFSEKNTGWLEFTPLANVTYALEYRLVGDYPPLSHIINLLLHVLSVVVLFNFLKLIVPDMPIALRFLAALAFAVHPLHTSVVDSLHGRSELLGLLFVLLGFIALYKWLNENRIALLFQVVLWLFLALLAQPYVVVWFLIPIYSLNLIHRLGGKAIMKVLGVFTFVLLVYGAFRLGNVETMKIEGIDNPLVWMEDASQRLASAIAASIIYLKLLVFPIPLCSCYGLGSFATVGWASPTVWLTIGLYGALTCLAFFASSKYPMVGLGAFIIVVTILPGTNIFQLQPEIANEKVAYGATVGLSLLFSGIIGSVFSIAQSDSIVGLYQNRPVLRYTLGVLILVSFYITMNRNFDWLNGYFLSREDAVSDCGKAAKMQYLAGYHLRYEYTTYGLRDEQGSIDRAEGHLRNAHRIHDKWPDPLMELGNLLLVDRSDAKAAEKNYRKALLLDPNSIDIRMLLASSLIRMDSIGSAIEMYADVLKLDPGNKSAMNEIVALYFLEAELASAELINKQFFRLHPEASEPYIHQGNITLAKGDTTAALNYYQEAILRDSENQEFIKYVESLKMKVDSTSPRGKSEPSKAMDR